MRKILFILMVMPLLLTGCGTLKNAAKPIKTSSTYSPAISTTTSRTPSNQISVSAVYAITGSITYSGTQVPGRVYLKLYDNNGTDTGIGTSIATPGVFSIRSVPSGTYTLSAWMDESRTQVGIPNAWSPSGSISMTINNKSISGQELTLADPPSVPSPIPPTNVTVSPGNSSAVLHWVEPRDDSGNVLAQYFNVYYSTSSSVSPSNGVMKTVEASSHVFINGLTDGTTYYFVVTSVLGGVESSAASSAVSATIGETAGSNEISGTISFPVNATGPMYVGVSSASGTFFQYIEKPENPQPYTISGVPKGAGYTFTFIDMNNDGVIDTGDLDKTSNNPEVINPTITINGNITGIDRTLLDTDVVARVITRHFKSEASPNDVYSLEFEVTNNVKLPVSVMLASGPNVNIPTDIGGNYYSRLIQSVNSVPKVGDTYTLVIYYSDGTSDKVGVNVTGVIDGFAQNLTATGNDRTIPTFQWSAPASPPAEYTYAIQMGQDNVGSIWMYSQGGTGMASSQNSILFNADGTSNVTSLKTGSTYEWLIYVIDSNGNQSTYETTYTP